MKKITVLVIDDSALIRQMFSEMLNGEADIEVIGTAADPIIARDMIKELNPDVITLDVEMPRMDGLTFLEKVMTLRPMPVVMASSYTQEGATETIQALEMGAVECIGKPTGDEALGVEALKDELVSKVRTASRAKVQPLQRDQETKTLEISSGFNPQRNIIAIGASTGGVEALKDVISVLPKETPPIVITQHMPENFTTTFAERLNKASNINVYEARDGMAIDAGSAYLAPGHSHLKLALNRTGHGYMCVLDKGEKVSGHKPSVDVLFESVAKNAGKRAVGVILTGMGKDGAQGLLEMKNTGAYTLAQNEESCVVYGMPKAAYTMGAVDKQIALSKVAKELLHACEKK